MHQGSCGSVAWTRLKVQHDPLSHLATSPAVRRAGIYPCSIRVSSVAQFCISFIRVSPVFHAWLCFGFPSSPVMGFSNSHRQRPTAASRSSGSSASRLNKRSRPQSSFSMASSGGRVHRSIRSLSGDDRVRLRHAQLNDRNQPVHEEDPVVGPVVVTMIGASCQTPLPRFTQR